MHISWKNSEVNKRLGQRPIHSANAEILLFLKTQNKKRPGGYDPKIVANTDFPYQTGCTLDVHQGQGHLFFPGHSEEPKLWSHTDTVGCFFAVWTGTSYLMPLSFLPLCDMRIPFMSW